MRIPFQKSLLIIFFLEILPAASLPSQTFPELIRDLAIKKTDSIAYYRIQIRRGDTLFKLFGENWKMIARFNRINEVNMKVGQVIKVPLNLRLNKNWSPMPRIHPPAKKYKKYILVSIEKQFLGFYQKGQLIFDAPISSGKSKDRCNSRKGNCKTPRGFFLALGGDKEHKSSLYELDGEPYPMPWAIRFYVTKGGTQYWLHGGNLPGYPDSHGCIRLKPKDARKLFRLTFGEYLPNKEKIPDGEFWINDRMPIEIK